MFFVLYLDECLRKINKLWDHTYPFVDDNTLVLIQKEYESREVFIARVAGINQKTKAIYSLYDTELSEPKSLMIPLHFRPKQLCLGGIKFVNYHRILGIGVGRNGKLHANHAQLLHKLWRHLIWTQIYQRQLNRNNDVELTLCMFNPFWTTNSLQSGQVSTKNNATTYPDCM